MVSPLHIEKDFQELIARLSGMFSKRAKLAAIVAFIKKLPTPISKYESYLIQLIPYLPVFENPYEYTGISPVMLKEHLETIQKAYKNIFDSKNEEFEEWCSALTLCIQNIYNWLGEREQSEEVKTSLSIFEQKVALQKGIHSVLVPVIDNSDSTFSGRLRNLHISVTGLSNTGSHDLVPVFSVIGAESGNDIVTRKPARAVNSLAKEILPSGKEFWQATAGFEHKQAWHSGNSANLAMAGLFFCAVLEAMEQREQFRLNPAIVITGDISETGEVQGVSEDSLSSKVEAAFFSWSQVLVAPASQLRTIYQHLDELQVEFPKRKLIVVGVNHFKDLFFDRRLTLHSRKGHVQHIAERAWKKRFNLAAVVMYLFLISVIASLAIGPIDRNPTHYEYTENSIVLKNELGRALETISIGEYSVENGTSGFPTVTHTIIQLFDSDGDGQNEILLGLQSDRESQIGTFTLLETNGKDTLWHRRLDFDVPYEEHPNAYHQNYRPILFEVLDIGGDGNFEILANLQQFYYFKSIIGVFDAHSGEIEQLFNTTGWQSIILTEDFDEDGILDALICGLYQGWNQSGCMLLGLDDINGFGPLHERYWDAQKKLAPIKLAFQIPFTIVGKVERGEISSINPNVAIPRGYSVKERELVVLTVGDVVYPTSMNKTYLNLIYDLDYHFNLVAIGSGDAYDWRALELYQEGKIPFLADAKYLHTFRDSLLWFDGDNWVQKPTLNKYFLEKTGEDSSYYKDWYFREEK